jgi:hypothetical protein
LITGTDSCKSGGVVQPGFVVVDPLEWKGRRVCGLETEYEKLIEIVSNFRPQAPFGLSRFLVGVKRAVFAGSGESPVAFITNRASGAIDADDGNADWISSTSPATEPPDSAGRE